jgi:hypothetical protein
MLEFTIPISREAVNQLVTVQVGETKFHGVSDAEFASLSAPIGSWFQRFFQDRGMLVDGINGARCTESV